MVGIAGQRDHYPERASNVGASRRWASWFLDVADENGGFFRTPIGHAADDLRVRTKRLVSLARGAAIAPILVPAVMTLPVLFETFPCAVYLI